MPIIVAGLCAIWSQPAQAGASAWAETAGAKLRVITEAWKPGMETVRGALQIELENGWKTYWREPGSAGIPPQVTVAGGASDATVHFPAPIWVDDGYGSWAGYTEPVSLPLTFTLAGDASDIAVDVFLGVCHDLCVPVTASFEIPLQDTSGSTLQSIQVDAAFAALPGGNNAALSIGQPEWTEDGELEISVAHAGDADDKTQLFLSAGASRGFKKPVAIAAHAAETVFRAAPLFDPAQTGAFDLIVTARRGAESAEVSARIATP